MLYGDAISPCSIDLHSGPRMYAGGDWQKRKRKNAFPNSASYVLLTPVTSGLGPYTCFAVITDHNAYLGKIPSFCTLYSSGSCTSEPIKIAFWPQQWKFSGYSKQPVQSFPFLSFYFIPTSQNKIDQRSQRSC